MKYAITLVPDPRGGYTVTFPDVPEAITEGDVGIGDAAYIAGLFFDTDDLWHANQLFQDVGGHIDTVSDGVVVDHDRQLAGAGDLAVPVRRLARIGFVAQARENHQAFGAE